MAEFNEFQEIAHCGGKITFHIQTEGGRPSYSVEFSHSRPTPSAIFAVYALPQGIPVDDIELGGIGQPWNQPPGAIEYTFHVVDSETVKAMLLVLAVIAAAVE